MIEMESNISVWNKDDSDLMHDWYFTECKCVPSAVANRREQKKIVLNTTICNRIKRSIEQQQNVKYETLRENWY